MYHESNLQQACVRWFRLQYPKLRLMLFATPNAAQRSRTTASRLKAEGMVSGVSDLILLTPRGTYGSLCIEMKYGKGTQSEKQKEWQKSAEKHGNKYVVCNTFEEFSHEVNTYLKQ